jgi:cytochrome oxidase assembly protein ShyY1
MKNDSLTTFLNLVLVGLVILCVLFGALSIWQVHRSRTAQGVVEQQRMNFQVASMRAQALLNDTMQYNATAKSPELAQIIQSVQPAAK